MGAKTWQDPVSSLDFSILIMETLWADHISCYFDPISEVFETNRGLKVNFKTFRFIWVPAKSYSSRPHWLGFVVSWSLLPRATPLETTRIGKEAVHTHIWKSLANLYREGGTSFQKSPGKPQDRCKTFHNLDLGFSLLLNNGDYVGCRFRRSGIPTSSHLRSNNDVESPAPSQKKDAATGQMNSSPVLYGKRIARKGDWALTPKFL